MKHFITNLLMLTSFFGGYSQQQLSETQLTDSIQSIFKEKQISGAFVTVVSKDSILFERGLGYATIPSEIKTTKEHLFKIGSVSKTFTALAIMKLVEDGKLSLEDRLLDIAPKIPFTNKWRATHPVKVKHLLEHKAGFDDMPISVIAAQRPNDMTALDEVLKNKAALQSRWQPGLGHAYSNPGYTILGYIIEKTTGQRYQDYIHENILMPLRMKHTHFRSAFGDTLPTSLFATGYMQQNDTVTTSRETRIVGEAAGSLLSNANDMSHFLQFMLHKKLQDSLNIVSASTIKEMETLHSDIEVKNKINRGYSLGLYTRTYGTDNHSFIGHSGGIHGFASDFIYSRELDLGIAISNNSEQGNRAIIDLLVDTYAKGLAVKEAKQQADVHQFSEWEGTYRMLTTRNQLFDFIQFPIETVTITIDKNELLLSYFLQDSDTLVSHGGIAFGEKEDLNPSVFLAQKDGKKYLVHGKDILVPVNGTLFFLLRMLLVFSLIISIVGILVLLVNLILAIFKSNLRPALRRNTIVVIPALALFTSMYLLITNTTLDSLESLGQFNMLTITIFLLTILVPIAAIWGAFWLFRNKKTISKRFFKVYYHLVVFAAIFLSVYCIYHGWFMKMMWA